MRWQHGHRPLQPFPSTSTVSAPGPILDPDPAPSTTATPLSEVSPPASNASFPPESQASQSQSQFILLDPSSTSQPSLCQPSALSSQPSDPSSVPELFPSPMDFSNSLGSPQDLPTDSDLAQAPMDVSETPEVTLAPAPLLNVSRPGWTPPRPPLPGKLLLLVLLVIRGRRLITPSFLTSNFISLNLQGFDKRFQDYLLHNLGLTSVFLVFKKLKFQTRLFFTLLLMPGAGPVFGCLL